MLDRSAFVAGALTLTSLPALGVAQSTTQQTINQQTIGTCSPTIANTQGNVFVTCNLTNEQLRDNARRNLQLCLVELNALRITQAGYLMPAMEKYSDNPTAANWANVQTYLKETERRLQAAIRSVTDYDSTLISSDLDSLHQILRGRSDVLTNVPQQPPDRTWVAEFKANYGKLMFDLVDQFEILQGKLG
jgi:hypothetical protein